MLDSLKALRYSSFVIEAMISMDSHTRICLLLDFYGQLLSDRARETLELHFAEDMSLAEIAGNDGISRQAIHDRIRRATVTLEGYETRLGLAGRFISQKKLAAEALTALDDNHPDEARKILSRLSDSL